MFSKKWAKKLFYLNDKISRNGFFALVTGVATTFEKKNIEKYHLWFSKWRRFYKGLKN
jgi:hypothetical protein